MGVFRQIKQLQAGSGPIMGSALVVSVGGAASGAPAAHPGSPVDVELQVTVPGTDPYETHTWLSVPVERLGMVVPGAAFTVWVHRDIPDEAVMVWED